jgi:cytochrome c
MHSSRNRLLLLFGVGALFLLGFMRLYSATTVPTQWLPLVQVPGPTTTATASATATQSPTIDPAITATATATLDPSISPTPSPTVDPQATSTNTATATSTASATSTATTTATATATATSTATATPTSGPAQPYKVLAFSKTAAFRHNAIPQALTALQELGAANNFTVDASEDSAVFTDANLANYAAVVFLMTSGDVLNDTQQAAFERYIEAGGGYVGVHSASDTEYTWPWYGQLVGAYFQRHPPTFREATMIVEDQTHPSTAHLGATWVRSDEWYTFQSNPRAEVHVLLALDESSYLDPQEDAIYIMGDHPIAWCHNFAGGRSWYSGLSHSGNAFATNQMRQHLLGGVQYAAGVAGSCPTPP